MEDKKEIVLANGSVIDIGEEDDASYKSVSPLPPHSPQLRHKAPPDKPATTRTEAST